ncbi:MAG: hypothetical protein P8X90_32240, partial [Desulfobacterales bacterium]
LNYGPLGEKRIQDLLPIRITGYQRMHELKSLALFCGRPLAADEPFLILDAGVEDSTILLKENDIPIITRKDRGFGRIVFLSIDVNAPPFSRWEGRPMFWDKILSLGPPAAGPALELDDQKILDSMLAGMPLKFPAFKWGIIFVAGYLIFLKLVLKKIGKPDTMRWRYSLGLLVMIIIFSAIAYRLFYYPNLSRKLTYNTFCQLEVSGPDVPAFASVFIGLYALQKSSYGLDFGSEANPVRHILSSRSRSNVPAPYVLWLNDRGQQIVGALNRRSHNFYRLQLSVDSPLAGFARQDNSFLTLEVENTLPRNLIDCLVYYKRRFVFVEDIPANTRQVLKLNLAELRATEIFNDQEMQKIIRQLDDRSGAGLLRSARMNLTKDLLFEIHKKYRSKADSMILIGWMPAGLFQPEFTPSGPPGAGLTLVCWQLPVERVS